jgi:predicted negative regulator of RcsB-dependent stress response
MAAYNIEEQERVDDLKAWWNRWGSTITWVAVAAAVVVVGTQGWRYWQASSAEAASALYSAVSAGVRANDPAKAKDAMAQLADKYSGTSYAPRAALLYARMLWDSGDKAGAKAQLQWTVDHAGEDELRQIARFRLAEVLLDEKNYDDALKTLDAKHGESFAGLYADLRGDVLAAAGRTADARAAYQVALAKLDAKSQYRNYVQVKLDSIGGPVSLDAPKPASDPKGAAGVPAPAPPVAGAAPATKAAKP